ncbi:MAG: HAD hydrolase-like protein, partial [Spirochaetota bacterium]|nr:HAD hydrolase-like protein [Spirochaetota bacterium]
MKNLLKDVDTIIFDNDGTLFQADLISFPAVVSAYKDLMKIHQVKLTIPSKNEINSHIGLPAKEYFKNLLPVELQKWSDQFEQMCVQHEIFNIQKGLGSLYDGVEETLIELKKRNF